MIWPVCPNCGAKGKEGSKFKIDTSPKYQEEQEPVPGEVQTSLTVLCCLSCTFKFPLWTCNVGQRFSWKPNAVDDKGEPWNPEVSEPGLVTLLDRPIFPKGS